MSLIVETGAIVAGAESYASVADANTYHANRGNAAWDALDDTDQKEPALRKATDYMLQVYRARWKGYRKSAVQALDWPRVSVYLEPFLVDGTGTYPYLVSDTIVPTEVKQACMELALRASAGELVADLTRSTLIERVGEITVTYDPNSPESARYRAVDAILMPYLEGSALNMRVSR